MENTWLLPFWYKGCGRNLTAAETLVKTSCPRMVKGHLRDPDSLRELSIAKRLRLLQLSSAPTLSYLQLKQHIIPVKLFSFGWNQCVLFKKLSIHKLTGNINTGQTSSEEGNKDDQWPGNWNLWGKTRNNRACLDLRKDLRGDMREFFKYWKCCHRGEGQDLFSIILECIHT